MIFNCNGTIFNVENVVKSPFLSLLMQTSIGVNKDSDGNPIIDVDPSMFQEYTKFLNGDDFDIEFIAELIEYMGHESQNDLRMEEWKDKLTGKYLVKVPLVNMCVIEDLAKDYYIAGGYALYLSGYTNTFGDIDIFNTCENHIKGGFLNPGLDLHHKDTEYTTIYFMYDTTVQDVKKKYRSMYDIVSQFDIDVCQFIYDGKDLWATSRALNAAKTRVIRHIPENMWSLQRTFHRLMRYIHKGFDVDLPVNIEDMNLLLILIILDAKDWPSSQDVDALNTESNHARYRQYLGIKSDKDIVDRIISRWDERNTYKDIKSAIYFTSVESVVIYKLLGLANPCVHLEVMDYCSDNDTNIEDFDPSKHVRFYGPPRKDD